MNSTKFNLIIKYHNSSTLEFLLHKKYSWEITFSQDNCITFSDDTPQKFKIIDDTITFYQEDKDTISCAVKHNHIDVLDWFLNRGKYPWFEFVDMINFGIDEKTNTMITTKFTEYRPSYRDSAFPSLYDMNTAARLGNIDVLLWATANSSRRRSRIRPGISTVIFPDREGMDMAAKNNHVNVIEWGIYHGIFPNSIGINLAMKNGHLRVMEVLYTAFNHGTLSVTNINNAARNGHLHILKWALTYGIINLIIFKQPVMDDIAANGHLHILKWLYTTQPTSNGMKRAYDNGHTEVVEWCKTQGIQFPKRWWEFW